VHCGRARGSPSKVVEPALHARAMKSGITVESGRGGSRGSGLGGGAMVRGRRGGVWGGLGVGVVTPSGAVSLDPSGTRSTGTAAGERRRPRKPDPQTRGK